MLTRVLYCTAVDRGDPSGRYFEPLGEPAARRLVAAFPTVVPRINFPLPVMAVQYNLISLFLRRVLRGRWLRTIRSTRSYTSRQLLHCPRLGEAAR